MDDENFIEKFKERVEAFIASSGMSGYNLGKRACNDGSFVEDLRAGREPRFSTIRKVDKFMVDAAAPTQEGGQRLAS